MCTSLVRFTAAWCVFGLMSVAAMAQDVPAEGDRQQQQTERQGAQRQQRQAAPGAATQQRDSREQSRSQSNATTSQTAQGERGGRSAGINDQQLAYWASIGNQGEITIAQMAQQRATNPEVKQFAAKLVKDHQQFQAKLEQAGGQRAGGRAEADTPRESRSRGEANRREQNGATDNAAEQTPGRTPQESREQRQQGRTDRQATQPQNERDAAANTAGDVQIQVGRQGHSQRGGLLQLKQQIAQRELESVQRELATHQGADFDRAFMGQQLLAHLHMLATLNVLQQHASPELQQVFADGAAATQNHLEEARQIMRKLGTSETGSRPLRSSSLPESETDR